eukprot:CAMPEP_0202897772 /NCGR_PEP_ID=MMETSP1392-20130828/6461_1 /ASSEMBLY_ACC=CAM_ASM_000868 /TAXON_ID=225041 /ORGANISM="Chlamydomonas chlamydogama, Strain SAG 11-48b" /LENGTH=65 /DNA_ID=CAMNT_0049583515 /DNA_START=1482 /DNA_END=1679 /DNA_ORIENTATION=+
MAYSICGISVSQTPARTWPSCPQAPPSTLTELDQQGLRQAQPKSMGSVLALWQQHGFPAWQCSHT